MHSSPNPSDIATAAEVFRWLGKAAGAFLVVVYGMLISSALKQYQRPREWILTPLTLLCVAGIWAIVFHFHWLEVVVLYAFLYPVSELSDWIWKRNLRSERKRLGYTD
ncbi:MAG: hypothetical protein C5B51_26355 [Terriglobia bacterium]|nr:MAG: hypothetical protein C5B51_26355 [Terriglobia bacterium]